MKCPNCRCVVPERMLYCGYCGYRFEDGAERTLSYEEAIGYAMAPPRGDTPGGVLPNDFYCDGFVSYTPYNSGENAATAYPDAVNRLLALFAALSAIVLLLLVALLVLLI